MHTLTASFLTLFALYGCRSSDSDTAVSSVDIDAQVEAWLSDMSLDEKVAQMHGSAFEAELYRTADNERLGIPGFAMSDGPRGVTAGLSTTFPVAMARGASWDPDLERRIGVAIAMELRAKGGNVILAPAMNLLRHPAWGRAQEVYGEDTHHMTEFSLAFVSGAQEWVVATPKHFAVNSIEDTRFDVDVTIDERSLRELYLPHFRAVSDAGAGAFMSAYNSVNGTYCAENKVLLTDILKDEWGFEGLVMSDWIWGTHDTVGAATAGLDIEMPGPKYYGPALIEAVGEGSVSEDAIDAAVRRILKTKIRFGLDALEPVEPSVVESPDHVALALEAALASMVLLHNEGALPLSDVTQVAVFGDLADVANLGDKGSSNAVPSVAVTPLEGIQAIGGALGIGVVADVAPADAGTVDAAVVVVGLTSDEEGEQIPLFPGGDRDSLALPADQIDLITEVAAANPRTVVVLEGGSAITVEPWVDAVQAVVMAWYPGMEGGTALGRLLFGQDNFAGRLPFSVPVDESHLPEFDHTSVAVTYDYFHGYRHLDHVGIAPRYAFGHGLSYTTTTLTDLSVEVTPSAVVASVEVVNTGSVAGYEVVQLYLGTQDVPNRAPRDLRAFHKVWLEPGEAQTVELTAERASLRHWDAGWQEASGMWQAWVGTSAVDLPLEASVAL